MKNILIRSRNISTALCVAVLVIQENDGAGTALGSPIIMVTITTACLDNRDFGRTQDSPEEKLTEKYVFFAVK